MWPNDLGVGQAWDQIKALTLYLSVTPGKSLPLSESCFLPW